MRILKTLTAILLLGTLAHALAAVTVAGAQGQAGTEDLLMRIGERVAELYERAKHVICIETSTVQAVDSSYSPTGFARTVESELYLEADSSRANGEASIVRKIRKVNGRAPREKDRKDRAGCTDPVGLSTEPLAFLLTPRRSEYQFRPAGTTRDGSSTVLLIDFASVDRRSRPGLIEDPAGHEDCFDWSGHIATRGRIWVDAATYEVLQVEQGLMGPVDVKVPVLIQRRHRLDNHVVIVRDDVSIRYKRVVFSGPDEVMLLPESIHSLIVVRGGLQSTRRHQRFSDYKRFLTGGRVLP